MDTIWPILSKKPLKRKGYFVFLAMPHSWVNNNQNFLLVIFNGQHIIKPDAPALQ
jgi:hypothetical protein